MNDSATMPTRACGRELRGLRFDINMDPLVIKVMTGGVDVLSA